MTGNRVEEVAPDRRRKLRCAVVQLDYRPAAVIDDRSPLADPLFELDPRTGVAADRLAVPPGLATERAGELRGLRDLVREVTVEHAARRLAAISRWCAGLGVELVVFPEYSVPAEALPELLAVTADAAQEGRHLTVVAGTHTVDRRARGSGVYAQLGIDEVRPGSDARPGSAVSPVLSDGRVVALVPKLSRSRWEPDLVRGESWSPVTVASSCGEVTLAVLVCLDFLHREGPSGALVNDAIDEAAVLAVPSLTPFGSAELFRSEEQRQAKLYGRPVLYCNGASGGHTAIITDDAARQPAPFPQGIGRLGVADEGVIVADLDITPVAPGRSTRADVDRIWAPVASASLVYTALESDARFAAAIDAVSDGLGRDLDATLDELVDRSAEVFGAVGTNRVRRDRIDSLARAAESLASADAAERYLRDVVLPDDVLPAGAIDSASAYGAANVVQSWSQTRATPALAQVAAALANGAHRRWSQERTAGGETAWRSILERFDQRLERGVVEPEPATPRLAPRPGEWRAGWTDLGDGRWFVIGDPGQLHLPTPPFEREGDGSAASGGAGGTGDAAARPRWAERVGSDLRRGWTDAVVLSDLAAASSIGAASSGASPRVALDEVFPALLVDGRDEAAVVVWAGALHASTVPKLCVWTTRRDTGLVAGGGDGACDIDGFRDRIAERVGEVACESVGGDWVGGQFGRALAAIEPAARKGIETALASKLEPSAGVFVPGRLQVGGPSNVGDERAGDEGAGDGAPAFGVLDEWFAAGTSALGMVVGGYGMGKTTTLLSWMSRLSEASSMPVPVYVSLPLVGSEVDLWEALAASVEAGSAEGSAPVVIDPRSIRALVLAGRLMPVLDGFDEMATSVRPTTLRRRLAELLEPAGVGAKMLLASREGYLVPAGDASGLVTEALGVASGGVAATGVTWMRPCPLNRREIEEIVRGIAAAREQDPDDALATIERVHPLVDLVDRPLLLAVVLATITDLPANARLTPATLLDRYAQHWIAQSEVGEPEALSGEQKLAVAEDLAQHLWSTGAEALTAEEFRAWARERLVRLARSDDLSPEIFESFGGMFFSASHAAGVRFAARPFLEYFLARSIARHLVDGGDALAILGERPLSDEVIELAADVVETDADRAVDALRDWLVRVRPSRHASTAGAAATAGAARNAVLVIVALQRRGVPAAALALEEADLRGVELAALDLRRIAFRGTRLEGAVFAGADVSGAVFEGAHAGRSVWRNARLDSTRFHDAMLDGADFRGSTGGSTRFDGASLRETAWRDSSLRGPHFDSADLREADVSGAAWAAPVFAGTKAAGALARGSIAEAALPGSDCGALVGRVAPHPLRSAPSHAAVPLTRSVLRSGPLLDAPTGHTGWVLSVGYNHDGTRIVSGSNDATVRVWDADTGVQLHRLDGHAGWVLSVGYNHDGTRIVTGSGDATVRVWDADTGVQLHRLDGHAGGVRSVGYNRDGTRIVTGSGDATVRVWDAHTGVQLHRLDGHTGWVLSVGYNSDGTRIVSGSNDATVRVWDADTGVQLHRLDGHAGGVRSVGYNRDGTRIVTGSNDATVRVWDAHTGVQLHRLDGHTDWVRSVGYNRDGTRIVTGSGDATVRVWDAHTGVQLHRLDGHAGGVRSVGYNRDGTRIVSGSNDATVRVWDADTGVQLHRLDGHTDWVRSVGYNRDGTRIVTGSGDATVRVWDAHTGVQLHRLDGHTDWVRSVGYNHDGTRIVSGSDDATVRVWDAHTGVQLHRLDGHTDWVRSVGYNHDGTRIVSGSDDATVRVWDADTGVQLHRLDGHTGGVRSVGYNHDGTRIVSASNDGTVRVWDADTGVQLHCLDGHTDWVRSVGYNRDGTRIVTGSNDATVRVWDAHTGVQLHRLDGHTGPVRSVGYNHDGTRIVSGSDDRTVRVWDADTGEQLHRLDGHTGPVWSVGYNHDGTRIVSASNDGTVRVWDADTGAPQWVVWRTGGARWAGGWERGGVHTWGPAAGGRPGGPVRQFRQLRQSRQLRQVDGHTDWVRSVGYNRDGTRIVSGSDDNTVRVWDAHTGEQLHRLDGHTDWVRSVGYNHDGTRIVTGSDDKTVRVWDAETGEQLHRLDGHTGWVRSVGYNHDGTRIVSASNDRTVRVWDAHTGQQLHRLDTDDLAMAVSAPDGGSYTFTGLDGTVRRWDPATGEVAVLTWGEPCGVTLSVPLTLAAATARSSVPAGELAYLLNQPSLIEAHVRYGLSAEDCFAKMEELLVQTGWLLPADEEAAALAAGTHPAWWDGTLHVAPAPVTGPADAPESGLTGPADPSESGLTGSAESEAPTGEDPPTTGAHPVVLPADSRLGWQDRAFGRRLLAIPPIGSVTSGPFTSGAPADEPLGRGSIVETIGGRIAERQCAVVVGPNRAGKTTILNWIRAKASGAFGDGSQLWTAQLDLASVESNSALITKAQLAAAVWRAAERAGVPTGDAPVAAHEPDEVKHALERAVARGRVVVSIDEVGRLVHYEPAALDWLRELSQARVSLLMAGTQRYWKAAIAHAAGGSFSSFANDVGATIDVGAWPVEVAAEFVRRRRRYIPDALADDLAVRLATACAGWPFYVQGVAETIDMRFSAVPGWRPDDGHLREIIDDYVANGIGDAVLLPRWRQIGRSGRTWLLGITDEEREGFHGRLGEITRSAGSEAKVDLADGGVLDGLGRWIDDPLLWRWVELCREGLSIDLRKERRPHVD